MQPHAEFVESEAESDGGVEDVLAPPQAAIDGAGEDLESAGDAEEENAVVEVMDVGAGDVEEKAGAATFRP